MVLKHKSKKISLQITIPENLNNNEDPKRGNIDLMYMGSRKRQDLVSKLGARGSWERAEGKGRGSEESREKWRAQ